MSSRTTHSTPVWVPIIKKKFIFFHFRFLGTFLTLFVPLVKWGLGRPRSLGCCVRKITKKLFSERHLVSSFYAVPSFQTDLDHDDENISSSVNFRSAQYEPGSRSKESRLPCDRIPFFSLEHNFLFGTLNLST